MTFSEYLDSIKDRFDIGLLDFEPPSTFDCERDTQNEFLLSSALLFNNHSLAKTYFLQFDEVFAGYVSLTLDDLILNSHEQPAKVFPIWPAVKIAQMGVDKRFKGKGLGQVLISHALLISQTVQAKVGCRFVTLDAKTDVVTYYEKQGFRKNKQDQKVREERARKRDLPIDDLPVSMRFDLEAL